MRWIASIAAKGLSESRVGRRCTTLTASCHHAIPSCEELYLTTGFDARVILC